MLLRISQIFTPCSLFRVSIAQSTTTFKQKTYSTAPAAENSFNFTEPEINRILDLINTKSGDHLSSYDISKAKLNKLEAWKQKHGTVQDINDILHVDGFSVKIVEKFCRSLLGEMPAKRAPRKTASFVTPVLPETQIAEIHSSVSINVGVSSVIWSRLELNKNGPCELTHWQRHDLSEKRLHLHDLVQRCLYVDHLIPQADVYIFENPQVAQGAAPGNAEQVNINVQRAQLTAILGFALANRNRSLEVSNVLYFKRFLAARLFQQLIGTERVSAEKTILGLMRTYYNVEDVLDTEEEAEMEEEIFSSRGNVCFPSELRKMYKEAEAYEREFFGQALLLNLAFVRLVLLRDAKAVALVTRNSKAIEGQ